MGKFQQFFKDSGLDMERVCVLVTDWAPSVAGKVSGLSARWSAVAPHDDVLALHCASDGIVHKTVRGVEDHLFHIKPPTSFIMQATVRHVCSAPPPAFVRRRQVDLQLERFSELTDDMTSFLRSSKQKRKKHI